MATQDTPADDEQVADRPTAEVTIMPALAYDSLVFVIPAHPERGTVEWGAFISLADARELHAKLGQALAALEG